MFSSFYDVGYEFEIKMKKKHEFSCVLDHRVNPPPHTKLMRATWSQVGVLFTEEFCMISAVSRFSMNVYDSSKYVQKFLSAEFI
jgi:hypothetical protein